MADFINGIKVDSFYLLYVLNSFQYNCISIFTAEAKAIDLALDFISTCKSNNKFIIFSDSLSVLKAMNHISSKNP